MTPQRPRGAITRRGFFAATTLGVGALLAGCTSGESPAAAPTIVPPSTGQMLSGELRSRFRRQTVGWTISYPPGSRPGDRLPVAVVLHGYQADHTTAFGPLGLQQAQAQTRVRLALASVDGGNGYWHPRADGDDPQGMVVHEFIPFLGSKGLETTTVALLGWSMGGYGALLLAETYPRLVRRVAAESPAIWPSYQNSQGANPDAFDSATDWERHDVLGHIAQLDGIPVRVDEGESDPFLWASQRLETLLPAGSVHFEPGAHDYAFWSARAPAQLKFLATGLGPLR